MLEIGNDDNVISKWLLNLTLLHKRYNLFSLPLNKHTLHFSKISTSIAALKASAQRNLILILMLLSQAHTPPMYQSPLAFSYLNQRSVPTELP